ncbi:MAG: hypothetical protein JXL81_14460 [Deltaproteobacteria bacterium]|nr:hypothetical protein [Deltaproteobacteria bacterium]
MTIRINTGGYGGRNLKKTAVLRTDDPEKPRIALNIEGMVENFATISPRYIRLQGISTKEVISRVNIIAEDKYPFSILESRAEDGKNIEVKVEPLHEKGKKGYLLTVKNVKKDGGTYNDTVILKTSSEIKPEIVIKVNGKITAPQIAEIYPRSVSLNGTVGESIRADVTITPLKEYPFQIVAVKPRDGRNINVKLEDNEKKGETSYKLTVNNIKQDEGRYRDSIVIKTNSEINPEIEVGVNGWIKAPQIAEISPEAVILIGNVGESLKGIVTIKPSERYPFKILETKADNGKFIRFILKEIVESQKIKYLLTIENKKEEEGFYNDTIRLKTSSDIQDEIQIRVSVRIGNPKDFNLLDIMKGSSKKERLLEGSFIKDFPK